MKPTKKQTDGLWGESGPYSEVNLIKQVRILDDQISRIFLIVEVNVNPTTFEIVFENRNNTEFKDDIIVQQLLDTSDYRGSNFGYVSMAFEGEYTDEEVLLKAGNHRKYCEETILKMHKFVLGEIYKITKK
ncbi:MAG: hypothetical protein NTZ87_02185 [Candidatus Nomurabacteria bacterium]|nr:hypothetical protein [Candidatus Nomurabacteria bacterium]